MFFFFFFNDTATTEIYTLSLHDALPISIQWSIRTRSNSGTIIIPAVPLNLFKKRTTKKPRFNFVLIDRKSTRLNSSHLVISYAVFCLKKKKKLLTKINFSIYEYTLPIMS